MAVAAGMVLEERSPRRRRGPPRGWRADPGWRGIAVAAWALLTLYVSSFPWLWPFAPFAVLFLLLGPALLFAWISRPYPVVGPTRRRRWICWMSLAAVASLLAFPWPMWLRFESARAGLEQAVADVRSGREVGARSAGFVRVREARLARTWEGEAGDAARGPVYIETDVGGFLHVPTGEPGSSVVLGERPWFSGWEVVRVGPRLAAAWYAVEDD